MNPVHFHLAFTHLPILGILIGAIIFLVGFVIKNDSFIKLSKMMIVVLGLITIPVYLTGEEAEESVEEISGVSHDTIHNHEEAAEYAYIFVLISAGISLISLSIKKLSTNKIMNFAIMAFVFFTSYLLMVVANLGGQIRHPEMNEIQKSGTEILEND